jgi:hypothetical protein
MKLISILVLFSLCAMLLLTLATLTGCEQGVRLRVANRLETDIIIVLEGYKNSVSSYGPISLGGIPAGQEGQVRPPIVLNPDTIGAVNIKAQDMSGRDIWERTWPLDEFLKFKKVWWQIVVSPDTGSYFPSY